MFEIESSSFSIRFSFFHRSMAVSFWITRMNFFNSIFYFRFVIGFFFLFFSEHNSVYTLLHTHMHEWHTHEVKLFARQEVLEKNQRQENTTQQFTFG